MLPCGSSAILLSCSQQITFFFMKSFYCVIMPELLGFNNRQIILKIQSKTYFYFLCWRLFTVIDIKVFSPINNHNSRASTAATV